MAIISTLLQLLLVTVAVNGNPLLRRGTLSNDQIVGLAEAVPEGTVGSIYEAYQPFLDVWNGCVPSPAVDANGNTNLGLPLTGASNSGCSKNLGQIYVRGTESNGRYAILYSWYMPKDEPSPNLGHRHDWEGVIVWLANGTSTTEDNILAVCPSAHGKWDCSKVFLTSGTGPLIAYFSLWPINHQCGFAVKKGGQQPLIAWESLPDAARDALQTTDFGSATVPFKDSTFAKNIAAATF